MKTYTCYCCSNTFQPGEGIPLTINSKVLNPYWCATCIDRVCFNLLPAGQTEKEIDRVCTKCNECKPVDEFTFKKKENRRETICKSCKAKQSREYYKNNKEIVSKKAKEKYQESKQKKQTNYRTDSNRYSSYTYTGHTACSEEGCNEPTMWKGKCSRHADF